MCVRVCACVCVCVCGMLWWLLYGVAHLRTCALQVTWQTTEDPLQHGHGPPVGALGQHRLVHDKYPTFRRCSATFRTTLSLLKVLRTARCVPPYIKMLRVVKNLTLKMPCVCVLLGICAPCWHPSTTWCLGRRGDPCQTHRYGHFGHFGHTIFQFSPHFLFRGAV